MSFGNYPPGVSGYESYITGECSRDCPHCDGRCHCEETPHSFVDTEGGWQECVECGVDADDIYDSNEPCRTTPCGSGDHEMDAGPDPDYNPYE